MSVINFNVELEKKNNKQKVLTVAEELKKLLTHPGLIELVPDDYDEDDYDYYFTIEGELYGVIFDIYNFMDD